MSGINCAIPIAPTCEVASGFRADSAWSCAFSNRQSTPGRNFFADFFIKSSYFLIMLFFSVVEGFIPVSVTKYLERVMTAILLAGLGFSLYFLLPFRVATQ